MVSLVSFLDENARRQPDHLAACAGVPTTYAMLCQLDEKLIAGLDLSSLQIAYSAGAPLPSRVRTGFGRMFGCRVLDCYGITEAAGNLCATLRFGRRPSCPAACRTR